MQNSISNLLVLKRLGVPRSLKKALKVISGVWQAPTSNSFKLNTYRMAIGCPGPIGGRGIFQNCCGFIKDCFMISLGYVQAFEAELCMTMKGFEYVRQF